MAALSVVAVALVVGPAPAGAAGTGLGQPRPAVVAADVDPVTASEVIARATGWTNVDVPYSQTTWYQGYRTDCSGFVSMTWALTSGGQPLSLVTQTLPNVATQIPFSQLMPGDALIFNSTADPQNGSHAELFGGWVSPSEQYFYVYQESGGGATVSIASFPPAPLDGTSQWYAYQDNDMAENLPAIPAVPPVVPSPPSALWRGGATPTSISVSWNAAPSATQYDLYRNGTLVAVTSSTSATDTGLKVSSTYRYQVLAVNGRGPSALSGPLTASTTPGAVTLAARPAGGYWVTGSNGAIYGFGGALTDGSMAGRPLVRPVVGMAPTADDDGYWMVAADGGIFSFGDARYFGSMGGHPLNEPIVGMAATADGGGYWLVAADGGIFSFGDARFFGSTGALHLNQPVVGMAATADGGGYWLVAADSGVFDEGDAADDGSPQGRF